MFVLRVMYQLLNHGNIVDVFLVSIGVWAKVVIFTHVWVSGYETHRYFAS